MSLHVQRPFHEKDFRYTHNLRMELALTFLLDVGETVEREYDLQVGKQYIFVVKDLKNTHAQLNYQAAEGEYLILIIQRLRRIAARSSHAVLEISTKSSQIFMSSRPQNSILAFNFSLICILR